MIHTGQCHCGAIRYEVAGDPKDVALYHCSDCRRAGGGVMWGTTEVRGPLQSPR